MTKIKYTGSADVRILDAADLSSLGVDGFRKTTFRKGIPVDVADEFIPTLTDTIGGFEVVEAQAPATPEAKPATSLSETERKNK